MTAKEVKIYAYRLTLGDYNVFVDELEFTVIEKPSLFILKEGVPNFRRKMAYDLKVPVEGEQTIEGERRNFFLGRKTLRKNELNKLFLYNFGANFIIYYDEPSFETAMMLFKEKLGERIKGFQKEYEKLNSKIQTCKEFVDDVATRAE